MLTIKEIDVQGYEKVIEANDPARGLHCFVAIHDSTLGPTLGGARMHAYATPQEALNDALRLAKAMTYKSAVAEDGLGGGKGVIIGNPHKIKTPELLHAYAEVVDSLKGKYITAEDVGTNTTDMAIIRQRTPYVAALGSGKSSGDPSRFTAWGIYRGIQAVARKLWHTKSLKGKVIAIQGLGNVGRKLANILFWEGANLIVCDLNQMVVQQHAHEYGALAVAPGEIFGVECDIFSPCALGEVINPQTVPLLRCKAIAGSANNQLLNDEQGYELMKKGILYAPDYIINSGGIINAATEFEPGGYDPKFARDKVNQLYDTLIRIFRKADVEHQPPNIVANMLAEYNLRHKIGKRKTPIIFASS